MLRAISCHSDNHTTFVVPPSTCGVADPIEAGAPCPSHLPTGNILHEEETSSDRTPTSFTSPTTSLHKPRPANIILPPSTARTPVPRPLFTPDHGHAAIAWLGSPLSSAPSTPSFPRPSARASRRSASYSSANDFDRETPSTSETHAREDLSLDGAQGIVMPSVMDAVNSDGLSNGERSASVNGDSERAVGAGDGVAEAGRVEHERSASTSPLPASLIGGCS
ncbi:hypothetical protein C2E23DRAFT_452824 [Lenzites betulinus]|nr:hypothetical protein C2E23DRAFT_452824 [Lenzites betulinus]